MSVSSALSLMIQFGLFVVSLLSLVVALVLAMKRKQPPPLVRAVGRLLLC